MFLLEVELFLRIKLPMIKNIDIRPIYKLLWRLLSSDFSGTIWTQAIRPLN